MDEGACPRFSTAHQLTIATKVECPLFSAAHGLSGNKDDTQRTIRSGTSSLSSIIASSGKKQPIVPLFSSPVRAAEKRGQAPSSIEGFWVQRPALREDPLRLPAPSGASPRFFVYDCLVCHPNPTKSPRLSRIETAGAIIKSGYGSRTGLKRL